jgi:hypothetical protein
MSRLGHHRQRASRSPATQAKPRLATLTDQHRKATQPTRRRALRTERAWLRINTLLP